MPDYTRLAGSTSTSLEVFIFNPATGLPDNTVVFNTSGLVLNYRRTLAANVAITPVTLAALTTAWSSGGFLLIGNGRYRVDVPNAAFNAGVVGVTIHGSLTNRVIIGCHVHLVAYNPQDAVRLGLTALPNVASGSAGAIPTTGTGANQVSVTTGRVTVGTSFDKTGYSITTNNDKTGYTVSTVSDKTGYSISGTKQTLDALNDFDSTADPVILTAATESQIDAIETDTNSLNNTKITTARANNLDNLDAAISGVSTFDETADTVNLSAATELEIDDIHSAVLTELLGFATVGTINDGAPTSSGFTVSSDFTNSNDHYNGLKLYVLSGTQKGRRATIDDQVGLVLTLGAGLTAAPENSAIIAIMS